MRSELPVFSIALALVCLGTMAWADQNVLKGGTVCSGKFVRGDANSVDFRILGRIESFRVSGNSGGNDSGIQTAISFDGECSITIGSPKNGGSHGNHQIPRLNLLSRTPGGFAGYN